MNRMIARTLYAERITGSREKRLRLKKGLGSALRRSFRDDARTFRPSSAGARLLKGDGSLVGQGFVKEQGRKVLRSISGYNHPITFIHREATLTDTPANLQPALENARRTLSILEAQAAGYTSLTIPAHLAGELEDARKKVAELEKQIAAQRRRFNHFYLAHAEETAGFAAHLAEKLESGFPAFPAFLDGRDLLPGGDYDAQRDEILKTCKGLILVVSAESECDREVALALRYKKPVIPICLSGVQSFQDWQLHYRPPLDFTSFERGLAALQHRLAALDTPAGQLQTLQERLADAQRDLRKAPTADRTRIQTQVAEMQAEVANWQAFLADPQAASERTERSIQSGLERERQPEKPAVGKAATKFINPPPFAAPAYFQDRLIETEQIVQFLCDDTQRLMTVVGRGGVGKTAMTCRLLKHLENDTLPDDLHLTYGKLPVDGIVYLSETGSHRINFPNLFADLGKLLPAADAAALDALYKDPQTATSAKMLALLERFPAGRVLVLLDNFENAIDAETHTIRDAELDEALRALLTAPHHTVKALLTTRIAPRALNLVEPSRQRSLRLEEGLDSPYAENVLRALDADGSVGLRDAPAGLLDQARRRTRGYPRALEALYASLRADYHTTLEDLLPAEDAPLPELVVEKLVGEAFHRLDPAAQQVMEALAIYNRPVAPAAVDFLLQPHQPGSNSAATLNRLVNMHFARRESGKFWLHPVDGEYALGQIDLTPSPSPTRRGELLPSPVGGGVGGEVWTQHALLTRAADYFKQARKPRQEWKKLDDLAAQLAEFDLRCAAGDFDTAADVLTDIDGEYLLLWGHYRVMVSLHEQIAGKINDLNLRMGNLNGLGLAYRNMGMAQKSIPYFDQGVSISKEKQDRGSEGVFLGNLGSCYADLGQTARAIEFTEQALLIAREIGDRSGEGVALGSLGSHYAAQGQTARAIEFQEQALIIAREIGDRRGEGDHLGNLGNRYANLGQIARAIEFYGQALLIAREIGDRRGEEDRLGNLGSCYPDLGQTARAIEFQEQALIIAREIGDRRGEGDRLCNLGSCYADLGQTARAIEFYEQALVIDREIGDRRGESFDLCNWAEMLIDDKCYPDAIRHAQESVKISEEIGLPMICNWGNGHIALAYLYTGDLPAARESAETAQVYDQPDHNHYISTLLGIICLRQGDLPAARAAFELAIGQSEALLAQTPGLYGALDAKFLALAGLVALDRRMGDPPGSIEASDVPGRVAPTLAARQAWQAARAINCDAGVVRRVRRLLEAMDAGMVGLAE
jgi:tetratricopeptide (TPR) repeat protein